MVTLHITLIPTPVSSGVQYPTTHFSANFMSDPIADSSLFFLFEEVVIPLCENFWISAQYRSRSLFKNFNYLSDH